MTDLLIRRLTEPPFGTETSERNLMAEAARALLATRAELARARADAQAAAPVAWKYRWKIDGEYVGWRYSDASNAHPSLDGYEEQPLYSAPVDLLRADAQAAVALALEQAAKIATRHWEGEPEDTLAMEAEIRALAPADGLAAVDALRAEARENAMQALASMGQAQDAYEAQLEAEAELAAAQQREADDWDALIVEARAEAGRAMRKFPQPNYVISKIAEEAGEVVKAAIHCAEGRETAENLRGEMKQVIAMLYRLWVEGDQVHGLPPARATLAQTPTDPGDGWTWNERLGWIGPDGKPADPRRRG